METCVSSRAEKRQARSSKENVQRWNLHFKVLAN